MNYTILIADDEPEIRSLLRLYLENEKYEIIEAEDGQQALELLRSQQPALCILDIMMPVLDGLEVCKQVRKMSDIPIIMLTAKDDDDDRILGLEIGADDYITKPFSVEELLARIRVTQRRLAVIQTGEIQKTAVFINGELKIDYTAGCTYMRGEELHLTPIEYKLLCLLSRNVGKVLTHTYITCLLYTSPSPRD